MPNQQPTSPSSCHLCGESSPVVLAPANANRHRTVICPRCRLIQASPSPTAEELETHYRLEFRGDAGGQARAAEGTLDDPFVKIEEARVQNWALPLVREFLAPCGKAILDLRCQSGALAAALAKLGAEVLPVDPFAANVEYAASQRRLKRAIQVPMSQFHELTAKANSFDAVTALNEHVPGHVLDCRRFLAKMWELLKPGGLFLLDEKHVLKPTRFKVPSLLDTGHAHLYHFVPETIRAMLEVSGFEILQCAVYPRRKSSFRHVNVVARKPATGVPNSSPTLFGGGPSLGEIRRVFWWSQQRYRLTQARYVLKRGLFRRAA